MNRRSLLRGLSLTGLVAMFASAGRSSTAVAGTNSDHECGDYCYEQADTVAREIIKETDHWKRQIHDWQKRVMVVTRCGHAGCEISLRDNEWQYKQRALTSDEREGLIREYGRSASLLLVLGFNDSTKIRGFILNGRADGWNLSIERL